MSILHYMILFVLLQPGLLLTLPAVGRSVFMSGKMSVQAVMVHALIFALVVHFFRSGGYFEGFAAVAPLAGVTRNITSWTNELNNKSTLSMTRINAIENETNKQIANRDKIISDETAIQKRYVNKKVSVSDKVMLDKSSTKIAQAKADKEQYERFKPTISNARNSLKTMVKTTIASASASLPSAVVSQLRQSASQLSTSQIAALQKVVTASASPSTILSSVKSIVPSISMPAMMSGSMPSMMRSGSMPSMMRSGSMPAMMPSMMRSGSMPTSLAQAQALAVKYGFKI